MNIQLSEHFTYKKLLRFILPSIIMMVFTSIYSVVDGIFVSNFVGKSAFASVNLIMPYLMGISALGFMIGTGGSAFVSKTLGEGKKELANQYFSMLVTIAAIGGFVLSVLSFIFMRRIVMAFGAAGDLIDYCTLYGRISCISLTAFMLQNVFQSFFVAAGKPQLGLKVIVAAGCTNIVLDALFIGVPWDFNYGREYTPEIEQFIIDELSKSYYDGITILGGDPMEPENQEPVLRLLRRIKKELPDKNVWAYTGYVYDRDLVPGGKRFVDGVTRELLESIDILIDGRFVEELKNLMLNFRGSGNQRIIKMKETLETGKVVLSELNN